MRPAPAAPLPSWRTLGFWRRTGQWSATLALLLIPFVRIDGASLLRLDLPSRTLLAFGRAWSIEELYLLLLLGVGLILLFLLVTLVLGRVWCGWACPQTTLADLAEGLARLLGLRSQGGRIDGKTTRKLLLHLLLAALSLLVAANLVWYFVSPYEFFPRLLAGEAGFAVHLSLALVAAAVYLDLAFLRRLVCRDFCPYGRFQAAMVDPGTLTLRFHPDEAPRCIRCSACVRTCPMGIDIRRGYHIECINCGRCLDACRQVMASRGQAGIIRYTFGTAGRGLRALLNPRPVLLLAAFLGAAAILTVAALQRPELLLKVERTAAAERVLADGSRAGFYALYLTHRGGEAAVFRLLAETRAGVPLEIRGPDLNLLLQPGERRRLALALVTPAAMVQERIGVSFLVLAEDGRVAAREEAILIFSADPSRSAKPGGDSDGQDP